MNNLDKFFKEKLQAPQEPPVEAWDRIQEAIDKKKKKRILPLWIPLSGVAASLLIGVVLYNYSGNSGSVISNKKPESLIVKNSTNSEENSGSVEVENKIVNQSDASQEHKNKEGFFARVIHSAKKIVSPQEAANRKPDEVVSGVSIAEMKKNLQQEKETILKAQPEGYSTAQNEVPSQGSKMISNQTDDPFKKKDVEIKKKVAVDDRFSLSAFFSPTSVQAFNGKSMLADNFTSVRNVQAYAYGAKVNYAINDKVKIRSGVAMMDMEQRTNNVPMNAQMNSPMMMSSFQEIAPVKANNIHYDGNLRVANAPQVAGQKESINASGITANLAQKVQYLEIPLEAEVKLLEANKFSLNVTVGGSSYLLTKNTISAVTADQVVQKLGTAENLNDVSFSANTGIKVDYKVSPKVKLNVEPTFKYMVKPINDQQKDKPYIMGVNTGVTFSF